jgi:hypothetical protein
MTGRWYALAAAVTLAVAAACSDRDTESTTGPQFAGGPTAGPCDFSNSLVTGYFPSSNQSSMLSLKQSMAAAGPGTTNARTLGFQIMDSIGLVSRNSTINPGAGAQLTIALIGCMFGETFTYPPEGALQAFTNALTSAQGGAYYVRGGGGGSNGGDRTGRSSPIVGRITPPGGTGGNLSGVGPSSSATWTNTLSINGTQGKNTSQGVLFYGYPVTFNPLVFEWSTVPSGLTFAPAAVFTVCDFDNASTANTMIVEAGAGVLSFVNSGICTTPQQPLTMLEQGWGPKALAGRLVRAFAGALTPEPLQAATVVIGATGGKASTTKSRFGKESVTGLEMEWTPRTNPEDPSTGGNPGDPSTWNGTSAAQARLASANVNAVTATSGDLAVRFCAYLSGTNNNGTPTKLVKVSNPLDGQDPECKSPPNGDPNALSVITTPVNNTNHSKADFGLVYVTKTGTITFTLSVVSGATAQGSLISQANVKPILKK